MLDSLAWTVLLQGTLLFCSLRLARDLFGQPRGPSRWLAAAVVGLTWLIVGLEILGGTHCLGRWSLLAWVSLPLPIVAISGRSRIESILPTQKPERIELEAILAIGLVLWASAMLGSISLFNPVKVVSDGPIYHLYFAARWWKSGSIQWVASPFGENASTYFPAIGDLWYSWLMTSWNGDRLAKIGQSPFFFLSGLTAFATARKLNVSISASLIAAAWLLSVSPFLLFSFEPNVDTIFVATYLLAIYFFVDFVLAPNGWASLVLSGLAAGLALGTKAPGILFVPVLVVVQVVLICRTPSTRSMKRNRFLIISMSPLITPAFFFVRNFSETGNPFYPLHLEAFGRIWLAGWYGPEVMRKSQYYIPIHNFRAFVDILLAVFDPRLALVWMLALVPLKSGTQQGSNRISFGFSICSALVILNIALYWIFIPYRTQQRFMLHAAALAAIPLAGLLDRSRWLRLLSLVLLAIHLLSSQNWPFPKDRILWDLSPSIPSAVGPPIYFPRQPGPALAVLAVGLFSIATAWSWLAWIVKHNRKVLIISLGSSSAWIAMAAVAFYPFGIDPRRQFYPNFPEYVRGWVETDHRSGPEGVRLAYAGNALPYYLMGMGLRNDVRYINTSGPSEWLLHDFHLEAAKTGIATWNHPRPGWDRIHPDYQDWVRNLRVAKIQLLVVNRVNPDEGPHNIADVEGFPIERQWAESHPEVFEALYGVAERDPQFRLYRLRLRE